MLLLKAIPRFSPPPISTNLLAAAKGIYPGRVAWAHDQDAVTFNPAGANGYWWDDKNTNPDRVTGMFAHAIDGITGATKD